MFNRLPALAYYPHPKTKENHRDKNSQTWSDESSMDLNPVEAPKTFFGLNCDCLNRKHNCDDHTFFSFHVSVYIAEDRSHFLLRINH